MIGIVSSPEPLKVREVILNGVYDLYGRGRVSNFLPNYNLLDVVLKINNVSVQASNISDFVQKLDMRDGVFSASFNYNDVATVEYDYCALRQLPHCVMMNIRVKAKKNISINVRNQHRTPLSLHGQQHYFNELTFHHKPDFLLQLMTSVARSPSETVVVAASSSFVFEGNIKERPQIIHRMEATDLHYAGFSKDIKEGEAYSFSVVGALISSVQTADPYNQAERLVTYMALQHQDELQKKHEEAWGKLWESDIVIEGNLRDQLAVRSMLYHLYAFVREQSASSPSPMGLSGLGYNGHVFWDSEIWIMPPLLILHPELARSMLDYRYNRLDEALKNAAVYGFHGAMFPWESAETGAEECPVTSLSGTFQHHITADVAIGAWNYYLVTGDKDWLIDKGWKMLKTTADFWVSRVEKDSTGKYHIRNVMGANEWAVNVCDDAYTNAAAKRNLEFAVLCAKELGETDFAKWDEIAGNLYFSQLESGVTLEHSTYSGEDIKQADVNLLAYPLNVIDNEKQIWMDLDYYSKKVPQQGTPAMTQAIFSILCSKMGDAREAYHWFEDSFRPNLNPPFNVIAECKGGSNPYFLTGAGGTLQAVIMGFGGIEINPKGGIRYRKTAIPDRWGKLIIKGVGPDKKTVCIEP